VVAIKVLPPSKTKDPNLLARFQREARLSLRLKHPNIVRTFQVGVADNLHYMVMEHLEGETLEDVMARRGKMLPAEAVRLVYQALQGLQHIHAQGLGHRDLKPSDLMLVPPPPPDSTLRCTVKILDIGLGRAAFFEESAASEGLTGEGVLLGTPDYMAPEQARDPRATDIYSLGCVLYHLLAGQPPFPDTNIISQMIRHATEAPRPLKELNPAVPAGLQQIVNWMMAKDPAGRYPTPERAAQALEVFLVAGAAPLSSPDLDPHMRPFLNWLEAEDIKRGLAPTVPLPALPSAAAPPPLPVGKPPSGAVPAAGKPPSATLPAAPGAPGKERRKLDKEALALKKAERAAQGKRRHKKARRAPPPVPGAAPAGPGPINVELVPVAVPPPGKGLRLGRRDLLMFGIGALGGGAAVFAGRFLAGLFCKKE
jgi:serine/threonine protein kinase